jgi:hypothetical protein
LKKFTSGEFFRFRLDSLTERRFRDGWNAVGKIHPKETRNKRSK